MQRKRARRFRGHVSYTSDGGVWGGRRAEGLYDGSYYPVEPWLSRWALCRRPRISMLGADEVNRNTSLAHSAGSRGSVHEFSRLMDVASPRTMAKEGQSDSREP